MNLLIRIDRPSNTLDLWEQIKDYGVNLTDLVDYAYVYGETSFHFAITVIKICALYGNLHIELSAPE